MPADLILLLIRPFYSFRRYRHGGDPPALSTRFFFLHHRAFNSDPPAACPSIPFPLSLSLQRLRIIEPFFPFLRHTTRQSGSLHSPSLRFGETKKMKSQLYFSFLPPRMKNAGLSIPWGRYRHGCDPPSSQSKRQSVCPLCISGPHAFRFYLPTHLSFLLSTRTLFKYVHLFPNQLPDRINQGQAAQAGDKRTENLTVHPGRYPCAINSTKMADPTDALDRRPTA